MLKIRNERSEDFRAVEELTKMAFWNVNFPGCDEHYLAHILRSHEDFVPELDLVLELDGMIIANIMYTKSRLVGEDGTKKEALTFGPLSVLPKYQRRGHGKRLLEYSFEKASDMGFEVVVIFGNPENYIQRGFKSCRKYNVSVGGEYPTALPVKLLREGALSGKIGAFAKAAPMIFRRRTRRSTIKTFPKWKRAICPVRSCFIFTAGHVSSNKAWSLEKDMR